MISVLHVATDYPDGVNEVSTKAVKNLVDQTKSELSHQVLSIVRRRCLRIRVERVGNEIISISVPRLKGAFLNLILMFFVYRAVKKNFKRSFFENFDMVHAHKLSIDGLLGLIISIFERNRIVVSIRGSTDCKWTKKDILGRFLYRSVLKKSVHVFWVSGWAKEPILKNLNLNSLFCSDSLLPNISRVSFENSVTFEDSSNKFVFVGRYDSLDSKGLLKCIKAISRVENAHLDIYGSYSDKDFFEVRSFIDKCGARDKVSFKGFLDNLEFRKVLSGYCALLMPSNPETFGITYVEALASNLPFLSSKNSGISGYLNNRSYAVMVDENSSEEIERGIFKFLNLQKEIKAELKKDIDMGVLDFLSDSDISRKYIDSLEMVV